MNFLPLFATNNGLHEHPVSTEYDRSAICDPHLQRRRGTVVCCYASPIRETHILRLTVSAIILSSLNAMKNRWKHSYNQGGRVEAISISQRCCLAASIQICGTGLTFLQILVAFNVATEARYLKGDACQPSMIQLQPRNGWFQRHLRPKYDYRLNMRVEAWLQQRR